MRALKDLGFGKVIITIRTITPIILILILILALIAFMSTTVFKYFIIIPKKIDRVFCRQTNTVRFTPVEYLQLWIGYLLELLYPKRCLMARWREKGPINIP